VLRDCLTKTRDDIDRGGQKRVLAKDLDGAFEREKEWLAVRGLLVTVLPRTKRELRRVAQFSSSTSSRSHLQSSPGTKRKT
jgi:hypothetical protein